MGVLWRAGRATAVSHKHGLLSPPGAGRRLLVGAFRGPPGSLLPEIPGTLGTPLVGGVSATDERLRPIRGVPVTALARPGGRRQAATPQRPQRVAHAGPRV